MSQQQGCSSGKTQHANAGAAKRQIASTARTDRRLSAGRGAEHRRVGGRVKVAPYRCPECDFWHVGHDAAKGKRGRRLPGD